ncbi:zinc finger protein 558-like [Ochlerotatus camptorhynchus]|uniref:zinc finger protein 558-like n=1 Tax=Ochlerotatus camptorhynchus TaxID=644619 RepID=UPI0031CF0C84
MSYPFNNDAEGIASMNIEAEELDIKEERLSDGLSEVDESLLEDLLVKKKPRTKKSHAPPSISGSIVCILCLRKCPPGSEVTFCSNREPNAIDVTEAQHKLAQALGILIKLQYRAMCPTCWKLIELITDFRQCCEKATKKLKVFLMGLDYDQQNDEWMAESTLNAIELKRQMVRKHVDQLDGKETKIKQAARQNRAKRQKKPENTEMVEVTSVSNEAQKEPKIEPSNPTTSNATEPVPLEEGDYKVNIFTCEMCGRNFDGRHAIRIHKTHCSFDSPSKEKYFSCPICTATFIEKSGLTFHLNKHKGIRPFKCRKFCDNTFFSNFTRIKHERKYCEKEGRICDICGMQLKNEGSLWKHTKNVHGEAKYTCNICGRKFRSSKNHLLHNRVHSEERNYVCTVCNKAFKAPFSLKVHKRIHTQEMPYACHLCEHAFNYKVSLKNHIARHHGSNNSTGG